MSAGVRTCAEIRSCGWRRANFGVVDAFYGKDGRRSRHIGEVLEAVSRDKMPEISKESNWLRSGHVPMFSRKLCRLNPNVLMEEKKLENSEK